MIRTPHYQSLAGLSRIVATRRLSSNGLTSRLAGLAALFVLELIVITVSFDTRTIDGKGGLVGIVADFGADILSALVVLATVLLALGYSKATTTLLRIGDRLRGVPLAWGFLAAHCAAMGVFAGCSLLLFRATPVAGSLLVLFWLAAGICGVVAGVAFLIPVKIARELASSLGSTWIYAISAALLTPVFASASRRLWKPAAALTFELVRFLVSPFVDSLVIAPATNTIGTQHFKVLISPGCSGLEGVGLVLVFSAVWLWFLRSEFRFPRALLLVPIGVCVIFLLNAVRIAVLILIGDAGARGIALGGFHSQAGWIAFNGVALGMAYVAHRVPWLSSRQPVAAVHEGESPTAAYLVPFLAILAAAMVSRAFSGSFEWMYPLRFVAATGALLVFRRKYAGMNWRFGWAAPMVGGLVFVLWIGLDRIAGTRLAGATAVSLSALPVAARMTWLGFRTLAAVLTVPLAEELAFRGFLLRRLISADFESVSFQRWSLPAVALSSVAFGVLHGDRWIAGTVAGILYAGAQKWRGRIGDAVVAHAVTNGLISVWVIWSGNWSLW